jgi:anti-sigma factor RsiW
MSLEQPPSSLDDDLKLAVRAAWGNDVASPSLHQRVHMAMTRTVLEEPGIATTTRSPRFWDRWPQSVRIAAAVAALLFVAIGTSWGLIEYQGTRRVVRVPDFTTPPAKPSLYAMLVRRHDDFAAGAEAPDEVPAGSAQALRDALAAQLHHGVWVPDLVKVGWKLAAVRVYPVNGVNAAAFNFTRNGDSVSAFSLPIAASGDNCAGSMPDIDELIFSRSFSAFSSDGQLFALVGSRGNGPIPQPELRALLAQFRDDMSCRAGCTAP